MLASFIGRIVYFFKLDETIINEIYKIVNYLSRIQCNESIPCDFPSSETFDTEFGALPVASRCWADYSPNIDETDAFSCSASDTCRVSKMDFGNSLDSMGFLVEDGNQIVCDSCPLQPGNLVNQYGCDVYTKQCTCNRCEIPR